MAKSLDIEFEEAVRLLVKYLPLSEERSKKPVLAHDIRVGVYLYENNYSRNVVLAGLLHDMLEFSEVGEQIIKDEFGENVLSMIRANTKDLTIENSDERIEDLIKRCAESGEEALIVKTADTLDSFKYYTKTNNRVELEYCRKNAEAILKYKPDNIKDLIFDKLKDWKKK